MRARPSSMFAVVAVAAAAGAASAQPADDLASFYGFDPMRIVVVDDNCGPVVVKDMNGDGRPDLVIVNNRKSRIEVHTLRAEPLTDAERARATRANTIAPSPWYDRIDVSVPHRVRAVEAFDVDDDGVPDLVYAGENPSELVILRQVSPGTFEQMGKRRVDNLEAQQVAFSIADVSGDSAPEIVTTSDGRVAVFPLDAAGRIGEPARLGAGARIVAVFLEDYDGDGMTDILGMVPDDAAPARIWFQHQDPRAQGKLGLLTGETRFEMPQIREMQPVRFPNRPAASIAVIERASRRIVFYDVTGEAVATPDPAGDGAERQVQAAVLAFPDGAVKERSLALADLDGDGYTDVLTTDGTSNTVSWFRQAARIGLTSPTAFSAFRKPKTVAVGQWTPGGPPEVFVLSEEEKAVGVATFDEESGRLSFPAPLTVITPGASPVAAEFVTLDGAGQLAIIVRDRRDHAIELHRPVEGASPGSSEAVAIELSGVNRPPQSLLAADADQDGKTDILLFTPNEPMVMVRGIPEPAGAPMQVLTDKDMRQFGLVQAAGPNNTALLDVTGDGKPELLIADGNFVRACVYDADRGWRVVEQINVSDRNTALVGLDVIELEGQRGVVAADKGNSRLVLLFPDDDGRWGVRARLHLEGFTLGAVKAGDYAGDGSTTILCVADDALGVVRLAGERAALDPFAAYRFESDDRMEHDLEVGDLNGDGFVDVAVLEAGEQMCSILTFSEARQVLLATEFEVFQSKLFGRGSTRQFEPRSELVADATGDGRDDLVLTVHDRIIIYPQMTDQGDASATRPAGPARGGP